MKIAWQNISISADQTHHLHSDIPLYEKKFIKVMKFHAPGIAPVKDNSGAYHIGLNGEAIYNSRYIETFGYYCELAAVQSAEGWFHINAEGQALYNQRYAWCGNFQENLCTVQDIKNKHYYHIKNNGQRCYANNYCYAGDYKEGFAVVTAENGLQTHIDKNGHDLHGHWFIGLNVFHKGIAAAQDQQGWFHINKDGLPLYKERYKAVEPFYNHIAIVENFSGALLTIDQAGAVVTVIRNNPNYLLHELSADMVGFWKTQTIYAAVKLNLFDFLPDSLQNIAQKAQLELNVCQRLLRALQELNLVQFNNEIWGLTTKGQLLTPTTKTAMAAAAIVWGDSHYKQWQNLITSLRNAKSDNNYFTQLSEDKTLLPIYHQALAGYAKIDYPSLMNCIDWNDHQQVIDAGGGNGLFIHLLLEKYSHLQGHLLEMPAVIEFINYRHPRCYYHGVNFMENWPCNADAIVLAHVLHDWADEAAIKILKRAKYSLLPKGKIYVFEMVLDPIDPTGSLLDINMLVMTNGSERDLTTWKKIINSAELSLLQIKPVFPHLNILVLEQINHG